MAQKPDDDAPTGKDTPGEPSALDALAEEARLRAARAAGEAAVTAAVTAAGKMATGVLDGIETLLFGRVGAAEEAAKAEDGDPLARLRARYDADVAAVKRAGGGAPAADAGTEDPMTPAQPVATARPPREDPVARARAELEALKAARGKSAPSPDEPRKKTL